MTFTIVLLIIMFAACLVLGIVIAECPGHAIFNVAGVCLAAAFFGWLMFGNLPSYKDDQQTKTITVATVEGETLVFESMEYAETRDWLTFTDKETGKEFKIPKDQVYSMTTEEDKR